MCARAYVRVLVGWNVKFAHVTFFSLFFVLVCRSSCPVPLADDTMGTVSHGAIGLTVTECT